MESITSFNLGIVSSSYIFGNLLIIKGIENPSPSVIERLNSILEYPRNFVLSEDNQEIYNNNEIFMKIYNDKNKTVIPYNNNFGVIFTAKSIKDKSDAFLSRNSIIHIPNYKSKEYIGFKLEPKDNYDKIIQNIISNEYGNLKNEIINFKLNIENDIFLSNLNSLNYIRWFQTAKYLYHNQKNYEKDINCRKIVGISFLRSILDKFNPKDRKKIVLKYFKDYLEETLYRIITNENEIDEEEFENPFVIKEINSDLFVISKYSGIALKLNNKYNKEKLNEIIWTSSTVDLADAILVSLASNTILVFEGPPGRGKTNISLLILEFLKVKVKRINFSPSTEKEHVFARIIPKNENGEISTEKENKELLSILKESINAMDYSYGLILDEMNLCSDELLEILYSYLASIKNEKKREYMYLDGAKFTNIKNIAVIITMNGSTMSNSRTSLRNTFLNLIHSFKIPNYTIGELSLLIKKKLGGIIKDNSHMQHIINSFIFYNHNSSINDKNTMREILKLQKIFTKIEGLEINDSLLELILSSGKESEINQKNYELKLDNENLMIGPITYPLNRGNKKEIYTQFTSNQKEAIIKILIGLNIEQTILLTGPIGSGKTYLIKELADLIGVKLRIIQFNVETNSSDLIGRFELNKNKPEKFIQILDSLTKLLIESKFPYISEYLILYKSFNIEKILKFLENNKTSLKAPEIIKKISEVEKQYDEISNMNNIVRFVKSQLLNGMKNGDWVLLDDIHFAPEQIERLMSLLEENPTLRVNETKPTLNFKKGNNNKDADIHSRFRLFLVTSNYNVISSAVKSRCFNVKLKPYKDEKDYSIILSNNLLNSGLIDKDIIKISLKIGKAFYNLQKEEKKVYILKNYILSPTNLINFAKLFKDNNINFDEVLNYLKYSIFSAFKFEFLDDKMKLFMQFINDKEETGLILKKNIKKFHEYYLSKLEIYIISYYINKVKNIDKKEDIDIKELNNKLINSTQKFSNLTKEKIILNVDEKLFENEFDKELFIKDIFEFTFKQANNYLDLIEEITKIMSEFLKKSQGIYSQLFFFFYLLSFLKKLDVLFKINELSNVKLNEIKVAEDFKKYGIKNEVAIKNFFEFKNLMEAFHNLIPDKINLINLEKYIIKIFYEFYENKYIEIERNKFISIHLRMIKIKTLNKLLKKFDILFPNEEKYLKSLYNYYLYNPNYIIIDNDDKIRLNYKNVHEEIITIFLDEINPNSEILIDIPSNIEDEYEDKINYKEIKLVYKYPAQYYKKQDIIKLYWFFQIFILKTEQFDKEEIKEKISPELFYFNETIENILGKKNLWKDIENNIKNIYKYLEGIRDINEKNGIMFNKDNDLFIYKEKENIIFALDKYEEFKLFFEKYDQSIIFDKIEKEGKIKEIRKILKNKKLEYDQKYVKDNLNRYIDSVKAKYDIYQEKVKKYSNFTNKDNNNYFEQFSQRFKDLKDEINSNKTSYDTNDNQLNNKIKILENEIEILTKRISILETKKVDRSKIVLNGKYNEFVNILYRYSILLSYIEEFQKMNDDKIENILETEKYKELNFKFLMDSGIKNDFESIYKEFYIKNINHIDTDFYKNFANYVLFEDLYSTNLTHKFINDLENIINVNRIVEDLNIKFSDNQFIYIPNDISIEFLKIHFFQKHNRIQLHDIEDNNEDLNEYFNDLKKKYAKSEIKMRAIDEFREKYIIKYKYLISELKKINFDPFNSNNDLEWLKLSFEELKENSYKNPEQILIKNQYNIDFKNSVISTKNKVNALAIFAIYAAKNYNHRTKWKSFLDYFQKNLKETKNEYKYGYRIMELYGINKYRDDISESMLIIMNTINDILLKSFDNDIPRDITNLTSIIYHEFVINIISEENPGMNESKIYKCFDFILCIIIDKYNSVKNKLRTELESEIKKCENEIFNKFNNLSEQIKNNFAKEKKSLEEEEAYFKKQNNLEKSQNLHKKIEQLTKEEKKFIDQLNNQNKINKDKYDYINEMIENYNKKIDIAEYLNYKKLRQDYNEKIKNLKKINSILNTENIYISEKIKNDIFCKENKIEENDLYKLSEWSKNIKDYSDKNIFKIEDYKEEQKLYIKNDIIDEKDIISNYLGPDSNFIFLKENVPVFLRKKMKIFLGLYIINYSQEEIGSIILQNNLSVSIDYELKNDSNNNFLTKNIFNKRLNLERGKNLEIKFKLDKSKMLIKGLAKTKFKINLYYNNAICDTCEIDVGIYIMNFILKLSLNNEKFIIKDNIIYINNHIPELNIKYELPGHRLPKLGICLKANDKNKLNIEYENKGNRKIKCNYKIGDSVKYDFSLVLGKEEIHFSVDYEKPSHFGLIFFDKNTEIFNEENENDKYLGSLKIMRDETKEIFIFNMTNSKREINLKNEKGSSVQFDGDNEKKINIEPGKIVKLKIKKIKIFNEEITLNGKIIKIETKDFPKIIEENNKIYCQFEKKIKEEIDETENFKLIYFNKEFQFKVDNIKSEIASWFSSYIIYKPTKEIINKKIRNHDYMKFQDDTQAYGFLDDDFNFDLKEAKNMKIILSLKDKNFSAFTIEQRQDFKRKIEKGFLNKITSSLSDNIKEGICDLIEIKDIDLNNLENSIKQTKNYEDKTSIINIIIYLMKYSYKFNDNETFKNDLEEKYKIMYNQRKIYEYFIPQIEDETIKSFLYKLSYIISFVLLCIFPGEPLKNEIENIKFEENNNSDFEGRKELEKIFEKYYMNNINQLNNDMIYYDNHIELCENGNNNKFDEYEKELKNINNYKEEGFDENIEILKNVEGIEHADVANCIIKNEINCLNLLSNLKNFEKYFINIPFLLISKKDNKKYKENLQIIYSYMINLKKSNLYQTYFKSKIDKYLKEFDYIISILYPATKKKSNDFELKFIKECKLPFDDTFKIEEAREYKGEEIIQKNLDLQDAPEYHDYQLKFKEIVKFTDTKLDNKIILESYKNPNFEEINNILDELPKDENIKEKDNLFYEYLPANEENKDENIIKAKINGQFELNKNAKIEGQNLFKPEQIGKKLETTNEKMLKMILGIVKHEDNKTVRLGVIRKAEDIKDCILEINQDLENKKYNDDKYRVYLNGSLKIQNLIYNIIKENSITIKEEEIALYSFENSFIDIAVDISQFMSDEHKILALIICIALTKSFTNFRVKIRISVFAGKDNIWSLSKDENFTNNDDIYYQILRLRDSLTLCKKRYFSVPADALMKLKQSFVSKGNEKSKYVQILISSLISAQIVDEKSDWDKIGQTIIIFGLKSEFSDLFRNNIMKDYNKTVEESILNIRYHSKNSNRSQNVHQRFFTLSYFCEENDNKMEEEYYVSLIKEIVKAIKNTNNENEDLLKRLPEKEKLNLDNIYKYKDNDNDIKEIENILKNINANIKNKKQDKYFAQNIFTTFNQKRQMDEIYQQLSTYEIPRIDRHNDLQNDNDEEFMIQKLDKNLTESLNSTISDNFEKNISTRTIYGSSGIKISIKAFISNFICSGGANPNIFERKGGNDKRRYYISFVVDFSESAFLAFNYQHSISNLILLLISPCLFDSNDEIFIDVIINSSESVKILEYNIESKEFKNIHKLAKIINVIKKNRNYSCCPGTCLYLAYKTLSLKRGDKKIFLITDSFITSIKEVHLALDLIEKFNNEKIDFCTIGVGSSPYGINKIYPKCCYTKSYIMFGKCLSICLGRDRSEDNAEIKSNLINRTKIDKKELISFLNDEPFDKKLINSIKTKEEDLSYILFNDLEQNAVIVEKNVKNPQVEVYRDGIFENYSYKILVIILYLGGNENKDKSISEENFKSNAGNMLEKKGFEYTIVYNYIDAIDELTQAEDGNCKYIQAWIFCSDGSGNTPCGNHKIYKNKDNCYEDGVNKIITKEDNEKYIVPFLETVSDFNKKGGSLLLFCDNEPFVLETNLLLTKYLKFQGNNIKEGSANFKMGGNYFNESAQKESFMIKELNNINNDKSGKFETAQFLKIGKKEEKINILKRYSLRYGITEFHEGITLSYAKTFDNSNNYSPFRPFAYLTDKTKEKPFILYYEPLIEEKESRGPIVVHGGFTSAFYEFTNEGTGKLLSSIACWLVRPEINTANWILNLEKQFDKIIIPPISQFKVDEKFTEWINNLISVYSILILDVSGSMETNKLYEPLIKLTNDIIESQKSNEENKIVIIMFGIKAKKIEEDKYMGMNRLKVKDINELDVGKKTNFKSAFEEAVKYIDLGIGKEFIMKRVLFLTDGEDNNFNNNKSSIIDICKKMKSKNFLLQFICFGHDDEGYQQLEQLPHDYLTKKNTFEEVKSYIMQQFAALA